MRNYRRAIPAAMLGFSMTVTGGGCSALGTGKNTPPFSGATGQPTPFEAPISPTPVQTPESYVPKKTETLRLLGVNATLQVIYIPVSNAQKNPDNYNDEENNAFRTKLLQYDRATLEGFSKAFMYATSGRYAPDVQVTTTQPIELTNGCVDSRSWKQTAEIENAAKAASLKGHINVVAVDADPCWTPGEILMGYASTEITPVILRTAFSSNEVMSHPLYAGVVVHEVGHSAGLDHAGKAVCEDPVRITNCTVDVTDDQNSVMSYDYGAYIGNDVATRFTAPELGKLGLLKADEVVTSANPGTVSLVPMTKEGAKLLVVQNNGHDTAYISTEIDPFAPYDVACTEGEQIDPSRPLLYTRTTSSQGGDELQYVCYEGNPTGTIASVQVRFSTRSADQTLNSGFAGAPSLAMVDTRKDTLDPRDPREDAKVTDGYTTPNTLILSTETYQFSLKSITKAGQAVIDITNK